MDTCIDFMMGLTVLCVASIIPCGAIFVVVFLIRDKLFKKDKK